MSARTDDVTSSTVERHSTSGTPAHEAPRSHLLRWLTSYASFGVPTAAAPIAFSLVALPLTGDAGSGAAMVLAMTLAQVIGSVPVSRLGARRNPSSYLRVLVGFRTLAYAAVAVLAWAEVGFAFLVVAAALAGLVGGAAYGFQRSLLNELVDSSRLPRALGIAATLNECTFAAAPVVASLLGAASPVAALSLFALLGAGPLLLIPRMRASIAPPQHQGLERLLTSPILLWLTCSSCTAAAVAVIEVGAVEIALSFGIASAWAFVFTLAVCIASVGGGVWLSVANRPLGTRALLCALGATVVGSGAVATHLSAALTVVGAILVGLFLAPLQTHYSLALDRLAPPRRRAETFALLRTAQSLSVIFVSALLTLVPLQAALVACTATVLAGTLAVAIATTRTRPR